MKLIQLGIASIVDANTGSVFPRTTGGIDYAAAENHAHRIRARSVSTFLQRIGEKINSKLQALYQNREQRRGIQRLAGLNDRLLDDIGVTRGDVIAAQREQIDLPQLEARRYEDSSSAIVAVRNVAGIHGKADNQAATNEAIYASAKCA